MVADFHRRCLVLFLALAVAVAGAVYLYQHRPGSGTGYHPQCVVSQLTGLDCAGCGTTRATHELLHLRFHRAFRYNPLVVAALPFLVVWIGLEVAAWLWGDRYRGPRVQLGKRASVVAVVVILLYSVLRNIPAWPFSLLAPFGG